MKPGEIIRIIAFTILGWFVMLWLQPYLYDQKVFGIIKSVRFSEWLQRYNVAAYIVFGISVLFTVLWYVLTLIDQNDHNRGKWRLIWYIGLGLLVLVISLSVNLSLNVEVVRQGVEKVIFVKEALISMLGLFILNSLVLLYWLPTATSTPGLLKNGVVPGSGIINSIFGRK